MKLNKIEYEQIEKQINKIKSYSQEANKNLQLMDSLINENIGNNKITWSGESANEYKKNWNTIANNFSSFIEIFNKQSANLENMLKATQIIDVPDSTTIKE